MLMAWYQKRWWYIERPFPWPLIALCVLAVAGLSLLLFL